MKIAILWTGLSGYLNACLKELAGREGVELLVGHQAPSKDAPYDESQFAWIKNRFKWKSYRELETLPERLRVFNPDVLVLAGWQVPAYRRLARAWRGRCWRVMTMDNAWRGTLKQWLGVCVSSVYLHPIADAVWLPGEPQAIFARKLGFSQSRILRGLYACDQPRFARLHQERLAQARPVPRAFLFTGRFVRVKGIYLLAVAYARYRAGATNPWPLICCGSGPLRACLEGQPGIRLEGFVQPERMTDVLAAAGCLVLPSEFEPWALAIHEAASAGLVILASERVGAAVHLVQPNLNGFIFDNRDVDGLTRQMALVASMSDAQLDAMSRASYLLSQQFTPTRWADTLLGSYAIQWELRLGN